MTPRLAFALLAGVLAAIGAWCEGFDCARAMPVLAIMALALAWPARLRPIAIACAGAWLAAHELAGYEARRLAPAGDIRLLVEARIDDLPRHTPGASQFTALLAPLRPGSELQPGTRASLRWEAGPELQAGERWQLLVSLHAPPMAANPGSTDQRLLALRTRTQAAGVVVASPLDVRTDAGHWQLDRLRARLSALIAATVAERDSAALVAALAVGDTSRVSVEQWRVFNAVGITHLVAISGLHVTAFSLVAGALAARGWRRWPWLQQRMARTTSAALVGLAAATGYALLAGWSVPTQRTLLMLAAWHGLHALGRRRVAATTVALGLAGVLLLDPLAPLAPGAWLSFLAVGSLMVAGALAPAALAGARHDASGPLARGLQLLREQAWVTLALLPVTVAVFGSASIAGLVVNLLAIPFFSLALVPLVLVGTALAILNPAFGSWPLQLAGWLARMAWPFLQAMADAPWALWRVQPAIAWYALAATALACLCLPWPRWMRASAILALVPLAWPARSALAPGEFAVTVFDAGGGGAVLVRTAGHALLFDDGEQHGTGGTFTARTLVPALRHEGVTRLDAVLLPALDGDRGAGLAALDATLAARPPAWLAASAIHGADEGWPPELAPCVPGTRWPWDGVTFEWLPGTGCALRVASGRAALLLPGAERAAGLRSIAAALPPTPIVVVPGQGARTAHEPALLQAASARVALLQATARDLRQATVAGSAAAWCASGAQVLATAATGAITVRAGADGRLFITTPRRAQVSCPTVTPAE